MSVVDTSEIANLAIGVLARELVSGGAVTPAEWATEGEAIEFVTLCGLSIFPAVFFRAREERVHGPDPKRFEQTVDEAAANLRRALAKGGLSKWPSDEEVRLLAALMKLVERELLVICHEMQEKGYPVPADWAAYYKRFIQPKLPTNKAA